MRHIIMKAMQICIVVFCALSFITMTQASPPPHAQGNSHKEHKHKDKSLPPGLQKKHAKGKALPPGWQKKLHKGAILDVEVYQHAKIVVPVDKLGLITVSIDDRLLRLHRATREIIDILK